jgi:Zn finger protein HypA/HybF involved in hydrogenase expression
MPLDKSCSVDAMSSNIGKLVKDEKKDQKQAVAISYSVLKKACGVDGDEKMTPKEIVAMGKKEEVHVMFGETDLHERLALSPEEAFKAEKERERREIEKIYGKPWDQLKPYEIQSGHSTLLDRKWKWKQPKLPKGAKVHKGPTVFGKMLDKSRLGEAGKAVVKAVQGVVDKFGMFGEGKRLEAVIDPEDGLVYLDLGGMDVEGWWLGSDTAQEIIREKEDGMDDDYIRHVPRNEAEADAYDSEWWDKVHAAARDEIAEAWKVEALDAMRKAVDGTMFKVGDESDFGMDEIVLAFTPADFGFAEGTVRIMFGAELDEGESTPMTCNECGAKFKKKLTAKTYEVKCPKCGSYDTEPA